MFTLILSFLRSHWQTAIIASAVAGIAATIAFQRAEIHHLGNKLAECHAEGIALENSNKALLASIQDQNAAIASLEALTRKKRDAAARAISLARKHATMHILKAGKIEAQAMPQDDCASLRKMVNDFVR